MSISLLNEKHKNFDLQVEPMSSGQQGVKAVKAILTIFEHQEGKSPLVVKKVSSTAEAVSFDEAETLAVSKVLNYAGVQ